MTFKAGRTAICGDGNAIFSRNINDLDNVLCAMWSHLKPTEQLNSRRLKLTYDYSVRRFRMIRIF